MSKAGGSDVPFLAEYAKSGRAKCKGCKAEIPKGECRLGSLTQVQLNDTDWLGHLYPTSLKLYSFYYGIVYNIGNRH